jgi:uncharacterized BrkB/YihY/UPF0761 family membrane protein
MENVRRHIPFFSRRRWGVKNLAPWSNIVQHTFHQFHENDLFTPAAAMSYFGLLTLFPALLIMLVIGNRFAAGSEALSRMVEIYPGSGEFLRATVRSLAQVGWGGLISAIVVTLWAGSWVFAVVERALNRIWGTRPRDFLHGRAVTLGMIGAVGLLLIMSVFMTSILVGIQQLIDQLPVRIVRRSAWLTFVGNAFWQTLFAAAGALITIALFAVVYAERARDAARHAAERHRRGAPVGGGQVHLRVEPAILPLRRNLRLGRRGRRRAHLELRLQPHPHVRRAALRRPPPGARRRGVVRRDPRFALMKVASSQ